MNSRKSERAANRLPFPNVGKVISKAKSTRRARALKKPCTTKRAMLSNRLLTTVWTALPSSTRKASSRMATLWMTLRRV